MRLSCKMGLERGVEIPKNFRQELLYCIKEAFIKSGEDGELFYKRWYSFNRSKPFTFSVYFPLKLEGGKKVLDGEYFKLLFSTNSEEFLIRVYNGLKALSQEDFKLFGSAVKVESLNLLPERKFASERAKFKTLSPFLIRDRSNGDYYIYPIDGPFLGKERPEKFKYWVGVDQSEFRQRVKESIVGITGKEVKLLDLQVVGVVPVVCGSNNASHRFVATYPGIKAYLELQARPEVLKILYDI
ncbi:MAG: CRISPR-associated endoribonuclease Cas6, partial [Aquificaceae bacterium]|nr:CRISPR-associated endoribonuclease Cas6 [Aquificaceae bacterium]